jgi:hypothetical protein
MYRSVLMFRFMVLFSLAAVGIATAQTPTPVVDQIEEDWQLVVATPDFEGVGPQITTSMSAGADLTSAPWVAFDMNYREYPNFLAGGMQLQVWSGAQLLDTSSQGSSQFSSSNETVTWTQRMSLSGGMITYNVTNGQSTSFGKFGQGSGLLGVTFQTVLSSLTDYSPTVTTAHSGVSWQSNNVTSLTLLRVRYYSGGLLVSTDNTPRVIDLQNAN